MSKGSETTTASTAPWVPQGRALRKGLGQAGRMFDRGNFSNVTDFDGQQNRAMDEILALANQGPQATQAAQGQLSGALGGLQQMGNRGIGALGRNIADMPATAMGLQRQTADMFGRGQNALGRADEGLYRDFDQVRDNVLGSVVPAAASMFSGSGMLDSSVAMDGVGRAATEAIAPIEYDAYNRNRALNAQMYEAQAGRDFAGQQAGLNRGLDAVGLGFQGASLAPGIDQGMYLPAQMRMGVGDMRQGMQSQFDNQNYENLARYMGLVGGAPGGQVSSQTAPGASPLANVAGAGLSGIGTYGALLGSGVGAPLAIGGGLLAGLGGLL